MESIVFRCQCGKKLQAQTEFVGRRLRCMGCARILTIPRPVGLPHPTTLIGPLAGRGLASGQGEFTRFTCSCGRKLKAFKQHAGSAVDCPACGRELTIPTKHSDTPLPTAYDPLPIQSPATARTKAAPATGKAVLAPVSARGFPPPPTRTMAAPKRIYPTGARADGLFVQAATPWPDANIRDQNEPGSPDVKSKAGRWLAVVLLLGLALLAVEWFFAPNINANTKSVGVVGSELAFLVPMDAVAVATVKSGDLWVDMLRNKKAGELLQWARERSKLVDKGNNKIEQITVVLLPEDPKLSLAAATQAKGKGKAQAKAKGKAKGTPAPSTPAPTGPANEPIVIAQMGAPVLFEALPKQVFNKPMPVRVGKLTMFVEETPKKDVAWQQKALCMVDEKTLLVSNVNNLQRFLEAKRTHDASDHPLAELLAAVQGHDAVVGLNLNLNSPFGPRPDAEFAGARAVFIAADENRGADTPKFTIDMKFKVLQDAMALPFQRELEDAVAKIEPALPTDAYSIEIAGKTVRLHLEASGPAAKAAEALWQRFADIAAKAPQLYQRP